VKRAAQDEGGYILAEFALSTVVLTLLVFGIIDFGRALYTYHLVANAARIGVRYAIVHSSCTTPCTPANSAQIQTYVQGLSPDLSGLTVVTGWGPSGNCDTSPYTGAGCLATVTATYHYYFFIPGVPSISMSSASQMIVSQ
jgi:Flp pilus assembly protein TadG